MLEETGANNLYLALGSLVWELDGRPLRSPLVLMPVVLTPLGRTGAYRLTLDESGVEHAELLPAGEAAPAARPRRPDADRAGRRRGSTSTPRSRRCAVALAGHGLPYRVEPTADLAILQFAKFRLWKDLDEHWADFADNPLVAHLVHEPTEAFDDPARDTGRVRRPRRAGRRSCPRPPTPRSCGRSPRPPPGRTFVLEGPPGTGKSQTITNLLTRAVAEGKRVLFVAEKRAALDVVARRLDAVGMGLFALDLHDKGSRASMVRAQIRLALEHAVAVDEQGLAADGEDLRSARRMLARYADRLHDAERRRAVAVLGADGGAGRRRRRRRRCRCRCRSSANAPADVLRSVRRALALLPDIADLTRPSPRHPWAFVDSPDIDLPATQAAAAAVDDAVRALPAIPELSGVLRRARTPDELDALAHLLSGPGGRPRRPRRDVHRALDGGDVGGARRDRGVHRVPPPGPRRLHARRRCACRWPRSTWPRRPRRRRPGSGRGAG